MKAKLEEARSSGKKLASGSKVLGEAEMVLAARQFIKMIQSRLPESIAKVGNTLTYSTPVKRADGSYEVVISFDSQSLYRDSVETRTYVPSATGVYNIVALFNNGYQADNSLFGTWHSTRYSHPFDNVTTLTQRDPLQFMQAAKSEFNATYGSKYNTMVELGSDYEK